MMSSCHWVFFSLSTPLFLVFFLPASSTTWFSRVYTNYLLTSHDSAYVHTYVHPSTLSLCILEPFVIRHPSVRLSVQDSHHVILPTTSESTPDPLQSYIGVHPTWTSFSSGPLDKGGTISQPPHSYPRERCHELQLRHHFASQD